VDGDKPQADLMQPLCFHFPHEGGNLPIYDVAAVAQALDLEPKQLDNLLSRNGLCGVDRKKRGIARRLTSETAIVIQLARELAKTLTIPIGSALSFAEEVVRRGDDEVQIGSFLTLRVDLRSLRGVTSTRLDAAVELVGRRRRGRPRGTSSARPGGKEKRAP
jgi:hypothetical protein